MILFLSHIGSCFEIGLEKKKAHKICEQFVFDIRYALSSLSSGTGLK